MKNSAICCVFSDRWTSKVKEPFICAPFPKDLVSVEPEAFPVEFCNSFYLTSYDVFSMSPAPCVEFFGE